MPNFFDNLAMLVADMRAKDWLIELFEFRFNGHNYFVLVRRHLPNENKPKYSLAKITFLDSNDPERKIQLHANSRDFIDLKVREFREFFHIPYSENGIGDAIRNFKERFGVVIPQFVTEKNDDEKTVIANYIDSDRQRNQGMYLSHVMRLTDRYRSKLTDHKAKLLRPDVYRHFKDDKTITFCFFIEPERERSEEDILKLFAGS